MSAYYCICTEVMTPCNLDLAALTKDVDLTLTNLLEGHVEYTSVEGGVGATPSPAPSPPPELARPPQVRTHTVHLQLIMCHNYLDLEIR